MWEELQPLPNQVILTFDIEGLPPREDSFDNTALVCLRETLTLLENAGFRGIFFITGSAAAGIREYPDLVDRLSCHEIGYHSSSHSVKPRIIEYTDVPSYDEALAISLERETSYIDAKTGRIKGRGGILTLRETFPRKNIVSFRAPFLAWSPPHLEALRKLGIRFDFSADISDFPTSFKELTFYPLPIPIDDCLEATFVRKEHNHSFPKPILSILLRRRVTVFFMHPTTLLIKNAFADREDYQMGGKIRTKFIVSLLRMLFYRVTLLEKTGLIEVTSSLSQNWESPHLGKVDVKRVYWQSVQNVMRLFGYNPRFILSHFMCFFNHDGAKSSPESSKSP